RRVPRRGRARTARAPGARRVGRRRRGRVRRRARPVALQPAATQRELAPGDARAVRRRRGPRAPGGGARDGPRRARRGAARRPRGRARGVRVRRGVPAPRGAAAGRVPRRRGRDAPAAPAVGHHDRRGCGMRISDTGDLWWKNAVIYCLDVETFMDWDDGGIGDFAGLVQRLDHLADLGVTCLWLMPFYPTADRDDGYDITDFLGVDPRLGDVGDLVELIRTANDRGIRVIADLVVNHTSDRHPWFKASRSSTDDPYRDFYVWRADEPPPTKDEVIFPDQEGGIWTKDDRTGEWYRHRFYRHM